MAGKLEKKEEGMSYDTKTVIVVLCLIFAYPIGLILMFAWMKWPMIVKLLVTIPVTFIFLVISLLMVGLVLATVNPVSQIKKAECTQICQNSENMESCVRQCLITE